MEIECLTSLAEIKRIVGPWKELLSSSSSNDIFLHPNWISAWFEVFGKPCTPFFVVLWREAQLVGLFPLCMERRGLFRNLIFVGKPVSDRMDFILKRGVETECIEAFVSWLLEQREWDSFYLENFGTFSKNAFLLKQSFERRGVDMTHGPSDYYYYIPLKSFGSVEEYFEKNWKKRSFKKIQRKFSKIGEVEWKLWDQVSNNLLSSLVELDARKSVRGEQGLSFFGKAENVQFFKKIIENFRDQGVFHVMSLSNSDGLVSFQIFFTYDRRILLYQTAYDRQVRKYGPGKAVIFRTIRYAFEKGFEEVDFLLGREDYKKEWTTLYRQSFKVQVFRKGLRGRILRNYSSLKTCLKSSKVFQRTTEKRQCQEASLHLRKLQTMKELFSYKEEWRRLLEQLGSADIFLHPHWVASWLKVYGSSYDLFSIVIEKKKHLEALFLLCAKKSLGITTLSFVGKPVSDRMEFIIKKGEEKKCLDLFLDWLVDQRGWDVLNLENLSYPSDTITFLKEGSKRRGLKLVEGNRDVSYYIDLRQYENYEHYLLKTFKRDHRNYFRRLQKKLFAQTRAQWEILQGIDRPLLKALELLEIERSFRGSKGASFFSQPFNRLFLENLAKSRYFQERTYIILLRSHENILAYLMCFVCGDRLFAYQTAYDRRYAKLSIGTQTFLESIRFAFSRNLKIYDFLIGDEVFKARFTKTVQESLSLFLYPSTTKGFSLYWYQKYLRPFAKGLYNSMKVFLEKT